MPKIHWFDCTADVWEMINFYIKMNESADEGNEEIFGSKFSYLITQKRENWKPDLWEYFTFLLSSFIPRLLIHKQTDIRNQTTNTITQIFLINWCLGTIFISLTSETFIP